MADTADLTKKLPRESTFQSLLTANQATATTLGQMLTVLQNRSTDIAAWKEAVLSLSTADKNSLKSAIYEVLGLNSSTQTSIEALPDIFEILDTSANAENGAGLHNSLYRGKSLGSSPTADQLARVNDGTFKGLWAGDYWSKSTTFSYPDQSQEDNPLVSATKTLTARILDHDYNLRCGDTNLTQHHLNMAFDESLFSAPMNKGVNKTEGGYVGSDMYTIFLEGALNAFNAFFGSAHVLQHREYLVDGVTDGYPSAGAWYDRKVDLMNEVMVYGSYIHTPAGDGTIIPRRHTVEKSQLAAFQLNKKLISTRYYWWLRDVVSAAYFASVGYHGSANDNNASYVYGVRPAALIY
ncbi:MAG: hypothetical protein IJP91_00695 [Synergistaceae bacterium]|nr:hypothetical protein [Synergistaceae bacterium]